MIILLNLIVNLYWILLLRSNYNLLIIFAFLNLSFFVDQLTAQLLHEILLTQLGPHKVHFVHFILIM
jgi:hypothetical protein